MATKMPLPFKVETFKSMAQLTPNWVAQLTRLKVLENYETILFQHVMMA